jgi:hypothetical protein
VAVAVDVAGQHTAKDVERRRQHAMHFVENERRRLSSQRGREAGREQDEVLVHGRQGCEGLVSPLPRIHVVRKAPDHASAVHRQHVAEVVARDRFET